MRWRTCNVMKSKTTSCLLTKWSKTMKTLVSGSKESKSKPTTTPTKARGQNTAQRLSLPSDENLKITEPAISLELRQTYLEEQVKQQNEMIEKWIKKVNTLEEHIKFLEGKVAVTETVFKLLEKKKSICRVGHTSENHASSCQVWEKNKWKHRKPDRNHH